MARYLTYTSPARGHLYPLVATLIELHHRGHDIAVRTLASEVARMRALGFTASPIAPAIEAIENDDWRAKTPVGAKKRLMRRFAERTEHELRDVETAIDLLDPDALLIDIQRRGDDRRGQRATVGTLDPVLHAAALARCAGLRARNPPTRRPHRTAARRTARQARARASRA